MKRRRSAQFGHRRQEAVAVQTGEHCPVSGWWYPVLEVSLPPAQAQFFGEGSIMPAFGGNPTLWLPSPSQSESLPSPSQSESAFLKELAL